MHSKIIEDVGMADTALVFAVVAGIIALGFAGESFFKKTGVPIYIFLILTGIILGPILNIFPRDPLIPELTIFAQLTLVMVLFYGGLELKSESILTSGARAFIQTLIYVISSITIIGLIGILILKWDVLPSFIFASMIGGETTAAVVIPLSRSMKLPEITATFLTMEAAMNSIFSIVLFTALVGVYTTGGTSLLTAFSGVAAQISVGVVSGAILSLAWVFILNRLQKQKFTYVLSIGLILATYALAAKLGGSGLLAVLVFGIILGNYYLVNRLFKTQMNIDSLRKQIGAFQEEISFLLRTLFFVFLGLTFVIMPSLLLANFSLGILFLIVLLSVRTAAVQVSTYKSELKSETRSIVLMCAQGLTPATLAILAVSLQLPIADTFLNIVTYVIILTNIVTTIGSIVYRRKQNHNSHPALENNEPSLPFDAQKKEIDPSNPKVS
jgi:potassium/hydrogen antiporter